MLSNHEICEWLVYHPTEIESRRHSFSTYRESKGFREANFAPIRETIRSHYVDGATTADRLHSLGAEKTAALLREELPRTKRSRSADMGEIFATEVAEKILGWYVPIRRLRWKDGRDMALRGDDLIALKIHESGQIEFLKGESKSRRRLSGPVIREAAENLAKNRGRPSRHSVLFISKRLRETGHPELAIQLERIVADSFPGNKFEHYLFTLSGNNPEQLLSDFFESIRQKRTGKIVVGVWVEDHSEFIQEVYERF